MTYAIQENSIEDEILNAIELQEVENQVVSEFMDVFYSFSYED